MEGLGGGGTTGIGGGVVSGSEASHQQQQGTSSSTKVVERLNPAVQQQLNLESVKTRAISLFKAISRILEDFDAIARTNALPKWQDIWGQFSMVNLELFNIVEDIKKVSKAFVVHPKNVNAENAASTNYLLLLLLLLSTYLCHLTTHCYYKFFRKPKKDCILECGIIQPASSFVVPAVLPVMLSSKLLPEMEMDDNSKREQLLLGMQNLPLSLQIDKLKTRIDMIGAACESAEKVIADTRKAYFGTRQGPTLLPTIDKVQAAKIQEQENLLRHAVNQGEGLRIAGDQRQITSSLPMHLVDILGDNAQTFTDSSGMYMKSTPPLATNNSSSQGTLLQASGAPHMGRAAASPSAASSTSFDNTTTSPMPYANSPRSGASMMNTPSPQQQSHQQQQQQLQQQQHQHQQRQKIMQLPQHQQQLLAQQQFRQSSLAGLGQNQQGQLHDLQGQSQQKFQALHGQHQMQFSQQLGAQQFQGRQLTSGAIQHGLGQSQLNQGNQLNRHLNQFSNPANTGLFSAAQNTPTSQMISNMSGMMPSQSVLPRMQFGIAGGNRTLTSQNLSDQMFSMGATNPGSMMPIQQQQQQQGAFGNMQNLQPGMVPLQTTPQNHPNFQQQRPQNQQ